MNSKSNTYTDFFDFQVHTFIYLVHNFVFWRRATDVILFDFNLPHLILTLACSPSAILPNSRNVQAGWKVFRTFQVTCSSPTFSIIIFSIPYSLLIRYSVSQIFMALFAVHFIWWAIYIIAAILIRLANTLKL